MKTRLLIILPSPTTSKVRHYLGLPPELTDKKNPRQDLGSSRFLVIEERPDGIFLYRYDEKGKCVGDTWHQNVDEAKRQAKYEFEEFMDDWRDIPLDINDIAAYGLAQIKQTY